MTPVKIRFFGNASISYEDHILSESSGHSRKIWLLLEYLIVNRHRIPPQEELIDILWPDEEVSDPANSLKVTAYRARRYLQMLHLPAEQPFLLSSGGSIHVNPGLELSLDFEHFDTLVKTAADSQAPASQARNSQTPVSQAPDSPSCSLPAALFRLQRLKEAAALFTGDFLAENHAELWVAPLAAYYHSKYLDIVHEIVSLLEDAGAWPDILMLCRRALAQDPYDEFLHYYLTLGLIREGSWHAALQHFDYVTKLFRSEFGASLSESFCRLRYEIARMESASTGRAGQAPIGWTDTGNKNAGQAKKSLPDRQVEEVLPEQEHNMGAYLCSFATFQDIYRILQRTAARRDCTAAVCRFWLTEPASGGSPQSAADLQSVADQQQSVEQKRSPESGKDTVSAFRELQVAVVSSLRSSDIAAQYRSSELLVLLADAAPGYTAAIFRRVKEAFARRCPEGASSLRCSVLKELTITTALREAAPRERPPHRPQSRPLPCLSPSMQGSRRPRIPQPRKLPSTLK